LADKVFVVCVVLAILAASLVAVWRFNQQAKYLGFAGAVLASWLYSGCHSVYRHRRQANREQRARHGQGPRGDARTRFSSTFKEFRVRDLNATTFIAGPKRNS